MKDPFFFAQSLPGLCHLLSPFWHEGHIDHKFWNEADSISNSLIFREHVRSCVPLFVSRYISSLFYSSCLRNLGHHFPKFFFPQNLIFRGFLREKKKRFYGKIIWGKLHTLSNALSSTEKKTTCFSSISPIFFTRKHFPFPVKLINTPRMKKHILRNAHRSILIWDKEGHGRKFMGKK